MMFILTTFLLGQIVRVGDNDSNLNFGKYKGKELLKIKIKAYKLYVVGFEWLKGSA